MNIWMNPWTEDKDQKQSQMNTKIGMCYLEHKI